MKRSILNQALVTKGHSFKDALKNSRSSEARREVGYSRTSCSRKDRCLDVYRLLAKELDLHVHSGNVR